MARSLTCLAATLFALAMTPGAMAQEKFGGPMQPPPAVAPPGPKQPIFCPPMLNIPGIHQVVLPRGSTNVPLGAVAVPGWNGFAIQFEPYYPPEIRQGAMICHYRSGGELDAYGIYQMVGPRRCFVRPDKRGFDCMR